MSIETQYVVYSAKNFRTGLTDVSANVFLDGNSTPVATGLALSEISSTNAPGRYLLTLTPAQLIGFGGVGTYKITINSASRNAPATAKLIVRENSTDDLAAELVIIDGKIDTLTSNLATLQADTTSIKGTVENSNAVLNDAGFGNAALKGIIDAVSAQVSNLQNATRTIVAIAPQLIKPASGLKEYKVEISIFNVQGFLEDPDSDAVSLTLTNASGNDRGNLFQGNTSGSILANKLSTGVYQATIEVSASTSEEALSLSVDYTENNSSDAIKAQRATEIIASVQATGLAQETTSQSILTDTADMQPRVLDIQSVVNDGTFGLAAIKALIDAAQLVIDDTNAKINDAGFGLAAIASELTGKASQISVDNIALDLTDNIKGAGFNAADDSLKAISDRVQTGGTAV